MIKYISKYIQMNWQQLNELENSKSINYKQLYFKQRQTRIKLEAKYKALELRFKQFFIQKNVQASLENISKTSIQHPQKLKKSKDKNNNKTKKISYKTLKQLQSIKCIQGMNSPLISNFAVYGIADTTIRQPQQNESQVFQGETLFVSQWPSQVITHSSKLVFPSGVELKKIYGIQSQNKATQILGFNLHELKTFILSYQSSENNSNQKIKKQDQNFLLQKLNPQNKMYAICLKVPQFTVIPYKNNNNIQTQNISQKTSSYTQTENTFIKEENMYIGITDRVYCIFSKYPVFRFFEVVIKKFLDLLKVQRLQLYCQLDNISDIDSSFHLAKIKQLWYNFQQKINFQGPCKLNQIYNFQQVDLKFTLSFDNYSIKSRFSQDWLPPIIRLFSLQNFIDIFTLVMLQQKLVFVCQNQHILTYTAYLFSNLLPRPFTYPYPTVFMIPNNFQYLNAPFPIIYGYLGQKSQIIQNNIHLLYPNVYIFLEKSGVKMLCSQSKQCVLNQRPSQLQKELRPIFQKMKPKFINNRKVKLKVQNSSYDFTTTKPLQNICIQILQTVESFLQTQVRKKIPSKAQIQFMKNEIYQSIDESDDLNSQVWKKILEKQSKSNFNNFFKAFMHTQLINIYLFQ